MRAFDLADYVRRCYSVCTVIGSGQCAPSGALFVPVPSEIAYICRLTGGTEGHGDQL